MVERKEVLGLAHGRDIADSKVLRFSEKLSYGQAMHEIFDPQGYLGIVSENISIGQYPIFYSNHTQHLNIAAFREIIGRLNPRAADMYVAIAHSLVNEGQDPKIVEFAQNLIPVMQQERIHFIPVAREKDINRLSKISKEKADQAARETIHNLRYLAMTFGENAGFIFFPEATTEGAVKVDGKRSGMIEVTDNLFEWLIKISQRQGREVFFVPVGMDGTNRIIEPRTSNPHLRVKYEIVKNKIGQQLGVDLGEIPKLARVVVGKPFGLYDVWEEGCGEFKNGSYYFPDKKELNTYMMKKVAELLPEEARGFYK